MTSSEYSPLVHLLDHRNIPSMSDLIHLCPFTIRCEQPSKQIEALSVCPDSLSSFFRYIFAIPAPRGGASSCRPLWKRKTRMATNLLPVQERDPFARFSRTCFWWARYRRVLRSDAKAGLMKSLGSSGAKPLQSTAKRFVGLMMLFKPNRLCIRLRPGCAFIARASE